MPQILEFWILKIQKCAANTDNTCKLVSHKWGKNYVSVWASSPVFSVAWKLLLNVHSVQALSVFDCVFSVLAMFFIMLHTCWRRCYVLPLFLCCLISCVLCVEGHVNLNHPPPASQDQKQDMLLTVFSHKCTYFSGCLLHASCKWHLRQGGLWWNKADQLQSENPPSKILLHSNNTITPHLKGDAGLWRPHTTSNPGFRALKSYHTNTWWPPFVWDNWVNASVPGRHFMSSSTSENQTETHNQPKWLKHKACFLGV